MVYLCTAYYVILWRFRFCFWVLIVFSDKERNYFQVLELVLVFLWTHFFFFKQSWGLPTVKHTTGGWAIKLIDGSKILSLVFRIVIWLRLIFLVGIGWKYFHESFLQDGHKLFAWKNLCEGDYFVPFLLQSTHWMLVFFERDSMNIKVIQVWLAITSNHMHNGYFRFLPINFLFSLFILNIHALILLVLVVFCDYCLANRVEVRYMSDRTWGLVKQDLVDGQNRFSCAAEIMAEDVVNYIFFASWTGMYFLSALLVR